MVCFNARWMWTLEDVNRVKKLLPCLDRPIYHICSGVSPIGDIRVDSTILKTDALNDRINRMGKANVRGDMCNLPFKSFVAGSVICDPPYTYNYTNPELIDELIRICKPRGKIVFIAPWIPTHKHITVLSTELWKVGKNRPYNKIRTLFFKSGTSLDYFLGYPNLSPRRDDAL